MPSGPVVILLAHGSMESQIARFDFNSSNFRIFFSARAGAVLHMQTYNHIAAQRGADHISSQLDVLMTIPTVAILSKTHAPPEGGVVVISKNTYDLRYDHEKVLYYSG